MGCVAGRSYFSYLSCGVILLEQEEKTRQLMIEANVKKANFIFITCILWPSFLSRGKA